MLSQAEAVIVRLEERGVRVTANHRRIVAALASAELPVAVHELQDLLMRQGAEVHRVTVHRVLTVLEREGLVHQLYSTGGYALCKLPDVGGCHHHLICRKCRRVEETSCPVGDLVEHTGISTSGFRVEHHVLELTGLCSACQME